MHRRSLLEELAAYRQRWPEEAPVVQRFVEFIEAHPDCFERSYAAGHITGSAWIVNQTGTHTLLTHHAKLDMWLQLGGHVDGNPNVLEAALREAEEESGLQEFRVVSSAIFDVDVHLIPARKNEAAHYHYDIRYLFEACHLSGYTVSDESHDLAWVEIDGLEHYTTEPSMLRMAAKGSVR